MGKEGINSKSKPKRGAKGKSPFSKDERIKTILGLGLLFFSIYLFFGFVSYLFTWRIDESKLDISFIKFFINQEITVENWAGKLGTLFAYVFIHNWFGLASFGIIFLIFLLALRFLNYRLLPFRKTLKYIIIFTIWISVATGYVFHHTDFLPGGSHGYFMSEWLNALVGKIGTAFILLVTLFGILAFTFSSFVSKTMGMVAYLIKKLTQESKLNEISDDEAEDEPVSEEPNHKLNEEADFDNDAMQPVTISEKQEAKEIDTDNEQIQIDDDSFSFERAYPNDVPLEVGLEPGKGSMMDNIETIHMKMVGDDKIVVANNGADSTEDTLSDEEAALLLNDDDDLELSVEKMTTEEDEPVDQIDNVPLGEYDPTLDLSGYKLPPIELLEDYDSSNVSVSEEELHSNKNRIVETLANYKIQIDKIKAIVGPTITLYEIVPAPGVRISKIKNLEDDIALSLAALGIRIIAPIPGRGTIGIEVPNLKPEVVSMRSVIASKKFQESKFDLPIALGKTISNETFVVDLTKMPHLLVAGATGQGKSVGLNAILTSMLYKKHPAQLKLVLVDPKKVELTLYQRLEKYFLAMLPDAEESIITDTQKVVNTLNSLTIEMDSRYDLLKMAHTRNIKEYNAKFISRRLNPERGHRFLPYIVVVIDEFADLIMTAGKEVELPIARLAQLARAIGIHLIIATQRPTTNIITGLIKANFPARIAFRVTSMMDSRTILDSPGANQLIGRGDMLISQGSDMVRLQCAFIDTPEIERVMAFIQEQQSYPTPYYLPEYHDENGSDLTEVDLSKRDSLFDDAARIIVNNQQGSTSLIQRKFSIGYNRAGRIIDQLEAAGIVGPFEGSKARQVLISDEITLEQLLKNLSN